MAVAETVLISSSPDLRSPGLRFRRIYLVLGVWGYAKMNELDVELEQLRQLVVEMVGREEVGCDWLRRADSR